MQVFIHKGNAPPAQTVIDTSAKLGRGATATIYRVSYGGESWAAKVYHKGRGLNSEKVLAMLANVPANTQIEVGGRNYPQFAWPCALLKDRRGADVGYLMPLVDIDDSYTLDHYYDQGLFKKLNRPDEAALSYKLEIAQNLSALVAELHRHQHYFIDFKPQNIRVFRRTHVVTLLDCDGFSIFGNGRRYPAELLSTDYIAPEAQRRNSSPADLAEPQDRYALAVILFQLLNKGTHPFQGIVAAPNIMVNTNDEKAAAGLYPHGVISDPRIKPRPQSTHHLWEDDTRALFDGAFTSSSPTERPSAREWADHFKSLLDNKVLVRCDRMPDNLEHIRFKGKGCPACYLSNLPSLRPQTRSEIPRVPPTTMPSAPAPTTGGNAGWGIIGGIVIIFLIVLFNSNDTRRDPPDIAPTRPNPSIATPNQAPRSPTQQEPIRLKEKASPVKEIGFVSVYVSNTRSGGWALGHPTQASADQEAQKTCVSFSTDSGKATCEKLIGGQSRCVAVARSDNGAFGAASGSDKASTENRALSECRKYGGQDTCAVPERGSVCE